jgi:hypothetical protein
MEETVLQLHWNQKKDTIYMSLSKLIEHDTRRIRNLIADRVYLSVGERQRHVGIRTVEHSHCSAAELGLFGPSFSAMQLLARRSGLVDMDRVTRAWSALQACTALSSVLGETKQDTGAHLHD